LESLSVAVAEPLEPGLEGASPPPLPFAVPRARLGAAAEADTPSSLFVPRGSHNHLLLCSSCSEDPTLRLACAILILRPTRAALTGLPPLPATVANIRAEAREKAECATAAGPASAAGARVALGVDEVRSTSALWFGVVWCGMVWYRFIWYGIVSYCHVLYRVAIHSPFASFSRTSAACFTSCPSQMRHRSCTGRTWRKWVASVCCLLFATADGWSLR
jgi:hypothetical protein